MIFKGLLFNNVWPIVSCVQGSLFFVISGETSLFSSNLTRLLSNGYQINEGNNAYSSQLQSLDFIKREKIETPGSAVLLRACLMFATFCFQHMSLHIQAPKKDPDYEEEDNNMGLCLFDNDLGDL